MSATTEWPLPKFYFTVEIDNIPNTIGFQGCEGLESEISVMETADAEVIDVLIFSTESLAIYHLIANKTAAQRYSGTDGMSWINLEFADNEQVRVDVSLAEDDYQQFQIDHCAI
jgi:hypothetical protein